MANEARKPISLDAPRTLGQEPLYNLETTVRQQFDSVQLFDGAGKEIALVVAKDRKKQTKIGQANLAFLCGLIVGVLGGRGDAPGGAALWTADNTGKMKHLNEYTLVAVPKKRGGTLEAPIPIWMSAVRSRADLIRISMEKHPIPKRVRETKTGDEEEEVDVWL